MPYINPKNPDCPNCNKSGLAILPARYAVVPLEVDAILPAPLGNKVSNIQLKHHKYALRTLRAGYLYLFHEKHARGSHIKWEIYAVNADGTLWKQLSPGAIKAVDNTVCNIDAHNIPKSVITIEAPEKCKRVWIAFSEHAWSPETIKAFEQDSKLRDRRMQTFLPSAWVIAGGYRHGLEATSSNIENVLEYRSGFSEVTLNGRGAVPDISYPDGSYIATRFTIQTTRYKAISKVGQSETLERAMRMISDTGEGRKYTPMIMAVWDAQGITHELNGYRNDAVGWIHKYAQERELEITALNAIKGVKAALENKAVDQEKQRQQETRAYYPRFGSTVARRARAETLSTEKRRNEIEVCDIMDSWAARDLPATSGFGGRLNMANLRPEPQRSSEIAAIKAEAEKRLALRDQNAPRMIARERQLAWGKYEEKFIPGAYQNFEKKYDEFLEYATKIIDDRTDDLISWVESRSLLDSLSEYNGDSLYDGVTFDDQVGQMVHGINSSRVGRELIDRWVREMKASQENLLWRSIALNQNDGILAVNQILSEAASKSSSNGALALDFVAAHVRKMADIYKKANTMQNTLVKSLNPAEKINKFKVTDFDRLFMTVGDKLFLPFIKRGVDTAAEFGVRGLIMARAGIDADRILISLRIQAAQERLARNVMVERLNIVRTFMGTDKNIKDTKYKELTKSWEDLRANPEKGQTAIKENRLSLLVATLEIVNLVKMSWEFKNDERTLGELGAAICSTIAAVSDIAANSAKHLVGDKVSHTFQYLKVFGGVLSATSGFYYAAKDANKSLGSIEKEEYGLALAYFGKSLSQTIGASAGLLAALSYAAPLMEKSKMKVVSFAGGRLLAQRLYFMTWAIRWNMVGLAITALIWIFTPEPLRKWCEESPFGPNKKNGPKNSDQLLVSLGSALQEVY